MKQLLIVLHTIILLEQFIQGDGADTVQNQLASSSSNEPLTIVNDNDFKEKMEANKSKLVIVDYTAAWCGPCKMMVPVLKGLSKVYKDALFFKVDVDVCEGTAKAEKVEAMPTFALYRDGKELDRVVGAKKEDLVSKIRKHYQQKIDGPLDIKDDNDFKEKMKANAAKLVIVDYTATWCGPCKTMVPVLEDLSKVYKEAVFFKVNIDKCKGTTTSAKVEAMPTFVLYRDGKELDRVVGAKKEGLVSKIRTHYQQKIEGPLDIKDDDDFIKKMEASAAKLVIVHYTATSSEPCQMMAPVFENFSKEYPGAVFFKVDVNKCKNTATSENVSDMPTFILYRDGKAIDRVIGAKKDELKSKIEEFYKDDMETKSKQVTPFSFTQTQDVGVPGYINLGCFINPCQCMYLNAIPSRSREDSPTTAHPTYYLESDFNSQIIIFLSYRRPVNIHSLRIKGPDCNGPKTISLFINHKDVINFDEIDNHKPIQEIELKPSNLEGEIIPLNFEKFQNVNNLQLFVKDNQTVGEEVTRIDALTVIGLPANCAPTSESKVVAEDTQAAKTN